MGCCGSRQSHDEDDVHTPLINKRATDSGPPATIDIKKEREFWRQVIHRTTENLIDISSALSEPLQHQDIQARTEKYQYVIHQVICRTSNSIPFDVAVTDEEAWNAPEYPSWLDEAVMDVDRALVQIKIEPRGDCVIPLVPP